MEYNFKQIEKDWQEFWKTTKPFRAENNSSKPKYYVLDMFPYPSGAGLHVGHPLGYIASDIVSRYKRAKGFNVLHPMGYDSFGLPAEQYAIQTGQHPEITTQNNIKRYREQLDNIGFSFDWDREVRTSDASYYRFTQWIFMQLYNSWYDLKTNKALGIDLLIEEFKRNGNTDVQASSSEVERFSAKQWAAMNEKEQQLVLLNYRMAFLSETMVNWCPALGSVLANEEIKDGLSERGGYPVERKLMKQWSMRITAYAQRLLDGLETIDWTDSIKEAQRNWIGRSEGSSIAFELQNGSGTVEVFTTRPDTIFGVSFLTLAPEHELVSTITSAEQKTAVEEYVAASKNRSERERQADVKKISGVFTGAYALHPFTDEPIPVWVGDYVLSGYGTGAVMAVPASDSRDFAFANHFNLPIKQVIDAGDVSKEAYEEKAGKMINSDFLNGLEVKDAIKKAIEKIEEKGIGRGKINYRLRDAIFSRQRYWGEPIPVYFKEDVPYLINEDELPLVLPEVEKYLPTETGEPPLARAKNWNYTPKDSNANYPYEHSTMPGWAGSSWYFLRYMDAANKQEFVSKEAANYWQQVDLYLGGSEHATGHLLYSRFWTKFLFDKGLITFEEPFAKLINQGMIQGVSAFVYKLILSIKFNEDLSSQELIPVNEINPIFISKKHWNNFQNGIFEESVLVRISELINKNNKIFKEKYPEKKGEIHFYPLMYNSNEIKNININTIVSDFHVDVSIVHNNVLDLEAFKNWRTEYKNAEFVFEDDGKYVCGSEVEKMSKSKWNVVNPDDIIEKFGADCLRMYEMFLGPLELSKPWNTNGITGVSSFLKKYWKLFFSTGTFLLVDDKPNEKELKCLHKIIKKVEEDIEKFSFNTSISAFMICVNELTELKCNKREILEPLTLCLAPFAPHIAEEVWKLCGHTQGISFAPFPEWEEKFLTESVFEYPVSINGKTKFKIAYPSAMEKQLVEKEILLAPELAKYISPESVKKVIVVPNRIINVVG
jgi:leucyl-tRNA synthetase